MRIGRSLAVVASLAATLFLSTPPAAQAASLDPSLEWHTADTEHFVLYWYDGEELVAKRMLEILESVHGEVTKAVGWSPKPKTHVVLTDITDSANGFAISVPFNTIRLFVTAPQEGSSLDYYDDWLRMLFTHEYTHICHIDKIGGMPRAMRAVFGSVIDPNQIQPRWIVEGYATYQETELSTAGRGRSTFADMIVRTAVLEDEFPSISRAGGQMEKWPNGYIPYIFGVKFLEYLKETYGEDSVKEFTRLTGREYFPFYPFFPRVNSKAKKVFGGKSFYRLWDEWHARLKTEIADEKARLEAQGLTGIERLTEHGASTTAPRISPDGKKIVYSMYNGKGPSSIRLMDLDGKNDKSVISKFSADGFAWTPDSKVFAFGTEKLWRDYYVWSDIYSWHIGEKRLTRLTRGARARTPDYRPDGAELLFVTNDVSNSDLATLKVDQSMTWWTNKKDFTQFSTPRWNPAGTIVAVSAWMPGGYREILLLDTKGKLVQRVTADRFIDRDPTWSAKGEFLLFSSDRTGIPNLFAYELASGSYYQVTNVLGAAYQPSVDASDSWIVFQGYTGDGHDIFRTKFDRTKWREIGWTFDPEIYDATCKPPKDWPGADRESAPLPPSVPAPVPAPAPNESSEGNGDGADEEEKEDSGSDEKKDEMAALPDGAAVLAMAVDSRAWTEGWGDAPDANEGTRGAGNGFFFGSLPPATAMLLHGGNLGAAVRAGMADRPDEPVPDPRDATEKVTGGGVRPEGRPEKNADVDLSGIEKKKFNPWRTLAPRYWLPAQVWFSESGATFGAFTSGTDPLFRHSWSAWVNYNTGAAFTGGGASYVNDRWRWTFYSSAETYVLNYGESLYTLPKLREPGSHFVDISNTGRNYYEQHIAGQVGAWWVWRSKYFLSTRYRYDYRTNWTPLNELSYQPFLPVRGAFAGPSLAVSIDKTEYYRFSISPQRGYRLTATVEAQEEFLGSDFRKEIGTVDSRAYVKVPFLPFTVLGFRGVAGYASGDDIRPSTFRLGGALGESVFVSSTPNYYSLRGFPFFAFGGERMVLGSAELRFPIWRAHRGIGTGPLYLRTIHGGVFADSGQAWDNGEAGAFAATFGGKGGTFADNLQADYESFHTGVGGELRMDTIWYYYFPITIRLGYSFALNDDPAGYQPGDFYGLIFTLGTSF